MRFKPAGVWRSSSGGLGLGLNDCYDAKWIANHKKQKENRPSTAISQDSHDQVCERALLQPARQPRLTPLRTKCLKPYSPPCTRQAPCEGAPHFSRASILQLHLERILPLAWLERILSFTVFGVHQNVCIQSLGFVALAELGVLGFWLRLLVSLETED